MANWSAPAVAEPASALSEVCLLVGRLSGVDVVLWADRSGDPAALPDARDRWEALWRHRDHLVEVAHSHPRGGLAFSGTDEATMAAVDAALGRRLGYAVVTADRMLRRRPDGITAVEGDEPWWATLLRAASGLSPPSPAARSHPRAAQPGPPDEREADRWQP